jgi:segregation and condensation protein B
VTEPREERGPISWAALAAELADELTGEPAETAPAQAAQAWDAVAARLAAGLRTPAGTAAPDDSAPQEPDGGANVVAQDVVAQDVVAQDVVAQDVVVEDAVPAQDDRAEARDRPAAPLGRAPSPAPVELEVVDPPEPAVEEAVPSAAAGDPGSEGNAPDPEGLRGGLEALLFVVDAPVDEVTLATALRCPVGRVRDELAALAADYDQRGAGVTLRRVGEGWRVYTREEHADVVERYLLEGQRSRLTQAALETLAVIAYRQPVTRARVSAIRGVGVDAVVRTLVNRGLVRECGTDPDTGGGLYATTPLFLERLGLSGLDELPELAPLLPEAASVLDEHRDA